MPDAVDVEKLLDEVIAYAQEGMAVQEVEFGVKFVGFDYAGWQMQDIPELGGCEVMMFTRSDKMEWLPHLGAIQVHPDSLPIFEPKAGDTSKRGRGTDKISVVGAVERGGKVKTKAVDKTELASDEMKALFMRFVDAKTSVLNTDEYTGYNSMNQVVLHRRVNHAREYTSRDLFNGQYGVIHTNTIEGYWAIVKRAIYGQFHHVSPKYLPLYLNELSYRFNQRQNDGRFDDLLHIAVKP